MGTEWGSPTRLGKQLSFISGLPSKRISLQGGNRGIAVDKPVWGGVRKKLKGSEIAEFLIPCDSQQNDKNFHNAILCTVWNLLRPIALRNECKRSDKHLVD
jgi:hypothetical protein